MTTVKAAEKDITVNGVRLHYLDWGTSGKMPLICLHNHGGQAHIWDEFAESMSSRYHVLALDQRGPATASGRRPATSAKGLWRTWPPSWTP